MPHSLNPTDTAITTEKFDDIVFDAALRSMAGVMENRGTSIYPGADPVINAGMILADKMGFQLASTECKLEGGALERFKQFARINGFRTRNVILEGGWWKQDCGTLLGFTEKDQEPVCLLRQKFGYRMVNTVTGQDEAVTEQLAQTLFGVGVSLYKPFPNKQIRFMDLYRMAARENRPDMIMVALLGSLGGILGMVTPALTGIIFDNTIPEADVGGLYGFIIILACLAFANGLFNITKALAGVRIQGRISNTVQSALWDRLLGLPAPFFRQFTSGELANKSLGINAIVQTISGVTMNGVLSAVFSTYNLLLLFYYNIGMALVGVLLTMVALLFTVAVNLYRVKKQSESLEIQHKFMGFLFQLMSGMPKVRMTGSHKRAFAKCSEQFVEKKRADYSIRKAENILFAANSMFPLLSGMVIFSWMIYKVEGTVSTGQFIAFNAAYGAFQAAMLNMAQVLTQSLRVLPLYNGLKPILNELPEFDEAKAMPGKLTGNVVADQISFKYGEDSPLILDNVTIKVAPGQFVAIVGGSGAGKSTLLRLLLGFDKPVSGTVFYDDQDLDSLDVLEVRRQLGIVLQNDTLIQGSILENIIGQSGLLTLDDAWTAAEKAGVADNIKEMPMGMHTVLPAGGGVLSGGQKQRVIIARALVKKPQLLYFDEATSALDNKTQAEVSRNLENLSVTRIVIAHRLSTIKAADIIYVLDKGCVVQHGTYHELVNQEGLFSDLAARQIV